METNKPSNFIRLLRKFREFKRKYSRLEIQCLALDKKYDTEYRKNLKLQSELKQFYGGKCYRKFEDDRIMMCIYVDGPTAKRNPEIIDYAIGNLKQKMIGQLK